MKHIYLFVAVMLNTLVYSQDVTLPKNAAGKIEYSEIVDLDSLGSNQLYTNSKMFIATTFTGIKNVGQVNDDKAATLITKGSIPVTIGVPNGEEVNAKTIFTVMIQCKNGKYKYTVKNFFLAFTDEGTGITTYSSFDDHMGVNMLKKQWLDVEMQTNNFVTSFIEDLKTKMSENVAYYQTVQRGKK